MGGIKFIVFNGIVALMLCEIVARPANDLNLAVDEDKG